MYHIGRRAYEFLYLVSLSRRDLLLVRGSPDKASDLRPLGTVAHYRPQSSLQ